MKIDRKGFTLVELLVVIAVVAVVLVVSIFGIIAVINNSKDKVTVISDSSIKIAANIYSSGMGSDSWKKNTDYDAFCVTIGELMNKGLLEKESVFNNKNITKDSFVIVKRNNVTLSIMGEEIVSENINDEYNQICTGQSSNGEEYDAPEITSYKSYTDKILIDFSNGEAASGIKDYKCLYGESSSSVNKEGIVSGNTCVLEGLKNNSDYYVMLYMNTNGGSSILATGDRDYSTSDFNDTSYSQNVNKITINYSEGDTNDNAINNPGYYFISNVSGKSVVELQECILISNRYICSGSTDEVKENVWYKSSDSSVTVEYPEENNDIEINTRIYDGSNNFKENKDNFEIRKQNTYTITYNLNGGSVSGNPNSYTSESADITLINPTKTGYTFVGWTGSNGNTPSTLVTISSGSTGDKSYIANWQANTYTITYNANAKGESVSNVPASQSATVGVETILSDKIPTRGSNSCNSQENYIFLGWSTNKVLLVLVIIMEVRLPIMKVVM